MASVTAYDRFISNSQIQFSRVYLKLVTIDTNMEILPINIQNIGSEIISSRSTAVSSNYIFKIRKIFINSITNALQANGYAALEQIISNAWAAKLNNLPIKSTLANNVFTTSVTSVQRYMTTKNRYFFKVEYTISIANRDPEYLGIAEPTDDYYQNSFKSPVGE